MDYQLTQLTADAWRVYSPLGVFMDLLVGSEKALLFDTGYGFGDLKGTIRKITDLPLYVVNSHGHVDHSCGNFQFEGPVYIHPDDMALCREHNSRLRRVLAVDYARHCPDGTGSEQDYLTENFDVENYLSQKEGSLVPVTEGFVFDLGGIHLRVIELPGHTKGSIGLLYEECGILYAGDAMNRHLWLFLPEALKLSDYRATLGKAIALQPDQLVLSHQAGFTDPDMLKIYLEMTERIDYENGVPYFAPLVPGATARCCCREGYTMDDMEKDGFASIVINRDHM